jgi:hypothetical protein
MSTPQSLWNHVIWKYPDASATSVDELEKSLRADGKPHGRTSIIETLKEFEKLKLGDFRNGRRGRPSRILWNKRPRDLAPTFGASQPEPKPSTRMTEHEIQLRAGVIARVAIPVDISAAEAERLCSFIRLLPIGDPSKK